MQTAQYLLQKEYCPNYINTKIFAQNQFHKAIAQNNSLIYKAITQNKLHESKLHRGNCTEQTPQSQLPKSNYKKKQLHTSKLQAANCTKKMYEKNSKKQIVGIKS